AQDGAGRRPGDLPATEYPHPPVPAHVKETRMHLTHTDFNVAIVVGDIALVLLASSLAVMLVRRIRQPAVIGEILAGIVLGPSVLGLLPGHLTQQLFPAQARPVLAIVSQVGLLLFMFLVGW